MHHIHKATALITLPARTAFAVANAGMRTTVRLVGWAAEQTLGQGTGRAGTTPAAAPVAVPEPRPAEQQVDPMAPTRTPPPAVVKKTAAKKAPARKRVPASQVPLKSAPTPSMPAGVEAIDAALEVEAPAAPATKAPAKKAPAKKATARKTTATKAPAKKTTGPKARAKNAPATKAPSEQAAVLAPALGLSEAEVAEVIDADAGTDNG